jgi:Mn-containing catalase
VRIHQKKQTIQKEVFMTIDSPIDLIQDGLRDMLDAEKRLTKAIPKMAKAVKSEELRGALEEHLEVTNNQVGRLQEIFETLGMKATAKPCEGIKGILDEGEEALKTEGPDPLVDFAIVCAARRVEHYEMAGYLSLRDAAQALGMDDVVENLAESLQEEIEADERLGEIGTQLLEQYQIEESSENREELEDEEPKPSRAPSEAPVRKRARSVPV